MVWTWLGQALLSVKHNIIIGFSSINGSFQTILFVTLSFCVRSITTCFWVHLIWLHIWNGLRLTYSSGLKWVCYVVEGSLGWCTAGIVSLLCSTPAVRPQMPADDGRRRQFGRSSASAAPCSQRQMYISSTAAPRPAPMCYVLGVHLRVCFMYYAPLSMRPH